MDKINVVLEQMQGLILDLSTNSIKSDWVKKELSSPLIHKLSNKSISILPVLIEYCNIPIIIKDLKYANFEDYESGFLN